MDQLDISRYSKNAELNGGSRSVERLVRALRQLEKEWPKGFMLFSNNGTLNLMRGHPEDGGKSLATFTIPSDGGDTFIE